MPKFPVDAPIRKVIKAERLKTMVLKEPQPCVEGVSLSGVMARPGEDLHHGQRPA